MRKPYSILLLAFCFFSGIACAQDRKTTPKKDAIINDLPSLKQTITAIQSADTIYAQNAKDNSKEHDVNSIILDIEKYIDSMHHVRTSSDQLLMKYFNPLRHFFLTTANKTTVATMFLYPDAPYRFCIYNDTALTLYLFAVKDGNTYNLSKMTEGRIARTSFQDCLLPSLKALDEFNDPSLKYIALSVYLGCKDSREGAVNTLTSLCLTLIARTADLQQYAAGLTTTKGLLANAELYLSDPDAPGSMKRLQINLE